MANHSDGKKRVTDALKDVKHILSSGSWVHIKTSELCQVHSVNSSLFNVLLKMGAIESRTKPTDNQNGKQREFKRTAALERVTAETFMIVRAGYEKERRGSRPRKYKPEELVISGPSDEEMCSVIDTGEPEPEEVSQFVFGEYRPEGEIVRIIAKGHDLDDIKERLEDYLKITDTTRTHVIFKMIEVVSPQVTFNRYSSL